MKKIIKSPAFYAILIIIIPGLIAFFLLENKKKETGYIVLSDLSVYECENDISCQLIKKDELLEKDQLFLVFENQKLLGKYKLDYIKEWNLYDESKNWLGVKDEFIAGSLNTDLVVKNYESREINEKEETLLQQVLKENNINNYKKLYQNKTIEYDFNKDGRNEQIILASNANEDAEENQFFSIALGIINNKAILLDLSQVSKSEYYFLPTYDVLGIINLFNQEKDLFILLKSFYSEVENPQTTIYNMEKKEFNIISKNDLKN